MIVNITIAGQTRTWTMKSYTLAECDMCYSRTFKRSKLRTTWYCNGCNEQYPEGKPSWDVMVCSNHGKQLMYNGYRDDVYWCIECETDALHHATQAETKETNKLPIAGGSPASD